MAGSYIGSRSEVEETLKFCESFNIHPVVETFSWSDFPKGYEKLVNSTVRFRSVVNTGETYDGL